jgi:hypothetical protein
MKLFFLALILSIFSAGVFAQAKAEKVDEFSWVPCGDFMSRAGNILLNQQEVPGSKIYVIYYEGRSKTVSVWNKKLKKHEEKGIGPIKGEALNYAKGLGLFLGNAYKFDTSHIVLIDGRYMEEMEIEVWMAPPGAAPPKPSPTVDEKDVVFRKGKLGPPRDCTHTYDGI